MSFPKVFKTEELLSVKDLVIIAKPSFYDTIAEIFVEVFKNYVLINNNKSYAFDEENILYKETSFTDEKSICDEIHKSIGKLIKQSFEALSEIDKGRLAVQHNLSNIDKLFINATSDSKTKAYTKLIKDGLTAEKSHKINEQHPSEMHFKNLYYSFKTGKFSKRIKGKHFISFYIDREYIEPTQEDLDFVMNVLQAPYQNFDDAEYIFQQLGYGLSGLSKSDQTCLCLYGEGENGKTTIFELLKRAIGDYFVNLQYDSFSGSTKNESKIFAQFNIQKNIRITFVDEGGSNSNNSFNQGVFKKFVDGVVNGTQLYIDGIYSVDQQSKLCIATNKALEFSDHAMNRRIDMLPLMKKFVKDIEVETSTLKKRDDKLLDKCNPNAVFKIIAGYGHQKVTSERILSLPDNFRASKFENASSCVYQQFFDNYIEECDKKNMIAKGDLYDLFNTYFAGECDNVTSFVSKMKLKMNNYDWKQSMYGIKGAFIGYKIKDTFVENCNEGPIIEAQQKLVIDSQQIIAKLNLELIEKDKKISGLEERLFSLEKLLNPTRESKPILFTVHPKLEGDKQYLYENVKFEKDVEPQNINDIVVEHHATPKIPEVIEPQKTVEEPVILKKKASGRPKKCKTPEIVDGIITVPEIVDPQEKIEEPVTLKKKAGRPKKCKTPEVVEEVITVPEVVEEIVTVPEVVEEIIQVAQHPVYSQHPSKQMRLNNADYADISRLFRDYCGDFPTEDTVDVKKYVGTYNKKKDETKYLFDC